MLKQTIYLAKIASLTVDSTISFQGGALLNFKFTEILFSDAQCLYVQCNAMQSNAIQCAVRSAQFAVFSVEFWRIVVLQELLYAAGLSDSRK